MVRCRSLVLKQDAGGGLSLAPNENSFSGATAGRSTLPACCFVISPDGCAARSTAGSPPLRALLPKGGSLPTARCGPSRTRLAFRATARRSPSRNALLIGEALDGSTRSETGCRSACLPGLLARSPGASRQSALLGYCLPDHHAGPATNRWARRSFNLLEPNGVCACHQIEVKRKLTGVGEL